MNGKKIILLGILILIGAAAWWLSVRPAKLTSVSGTVEIDEVHIASRYGGRVVRLYAQEGDALQGGQPIAELDATELTARRDYAAAVLAELEHGPRTNEIANARRTWESLAADLAFAVAENSRAREMYDQKVISASDRDNAASREESLAKQAGAAKAEYDLLVEGTRPERITQARAQLAEIESDLAEMRIGAPVSSAPTTNATPDYVLEVLSVKVGDVLPANREIATLIMSQHLWVRVFVPETWIGLIQVGAPVKVQTDSTPDREFTGVVEQINRQAEFTPRNVQTVDDRIRQVFGVKVRLPTDTGLLRAGMSVDVLIPNMPPAPR